MENKNPASWEEKRRWKENFGSKTITGLDRTVGIGNYVTTLYGRYRLEILAGIYARSIEVIKTEGGYVEIGTFAQYQNPDAFSWALKQADTDGNEIITSEEIRNLTKRMHEEYTT